MDRSQQLGLVELGDEELVGIEGGSWASWGAGAAFGFVVACTTLNPIAGAVACAVFTAELEAVGF